MGSILHSFLNSLGRLPCFIVCFLPILASWQNAQQYTTCVWGSVSWWSGISYVLVTVSVTIAAFSRAVFSAPCPTPSVEDQGPFVVHAVWPLPCNQSGMVRPAGLLQNGVVYHRLFSIRPVWWSNTSQSLLGSTWLQIKASHYPTGCCVVISACEAAMCLQAAGHILGGCCAQLHWESVWASRNVLMEITAEHMIAPTSAVMLGPTSNNFAHARTQAHTYTHAHTFTCFHSPSWSQTQSPLSEN